MFLTIFHELIKFSVIKLYLNISHAMHTNEDAKHVSSGWHVNFWNFLSMAFCFMMKENHFKQSCYFGLRSPLKIKYTEYFILQILGRNTKRLPLLSSDTRLVRSFLACFCLVLNLSQEMLPHRILMITLHTFQFFNTIKVLNGSFILLLSLIFIFSMIFISFFLWRILQVPIMLQLKAFLHFFIRSHFIRN